jgi:hypothetical protein
LVHETGILGLVRSILFIVPTKPVSNQHRSEITALNLYPCHGPAVSADVFNRGTDAFSANILTGLPGSSTTI